MDEFQHWHISEAGLALVLAKLADATDAAILTAYRATYTPARNIQRNRELRAAFNAKKLGSYGLVGHWEESQPDGTKKLVTERSMLVINAGRSRKTFQRVILEMVQKYEQDAAVVREDGVYYVLENNGNKVRIGSKVAINKVAQAYSTFVRKSNVPFVFEGVYVPTTISARRVAKYKGILYPLVEDTVIRSEAVRESIRRAV